MKSKQYGALFGLMTLIVILGVASETSIMTASAQSVSQGRHCTAYNPCIQVCGDHVCAPGELAQMTQSTKAQGNNSGTSATPASMMAPSQGVILGKVVSFMDVASDGTQVIVRTGHPISGQTLDIAIAFFDASNNFVKHQNYAITVTQDNNTVLTNSVGHTHTGTDTQTTSALTSANPVNIEITLNGVGLPNTDPSTWTGVKGGVLDFSQIRDVQTPTTMSNMIMTNATSVIPASNATVPEFGPVASIVLAIAVLSIVVFAAKTRVIPRF